MDNSEIKTFINTLKEAGDIWEPSDVKRVYGEVSLDDALQDRINDLHWFADIVHKANEAIKVI